jgi:phosphoglycolate phosphatase
VSACYTLGVAHIIFDFDGTIADSLPLVIKLYEDMIRGGQPMPREEVERLRGMSLLRVGRELRIMPWRIPVLLGRGRARMRHEIGNVPVFPGMPELIRQLHDDGHTLYIVSSNSVHNIRPFLKRFELNKQFKHMYGNAGLLGKGRLLKLVAKRNRLNLSDTVYIGDEVRDIEAAKKAGMRIISVTWGYNTESVLREHAPDFVAMNPGDILKALTSLH